MNKEVKIKDVLSPPNELNDIFIICQNEINLSGNNLLHTEFYSRIYLDCLMQYYGLTYGSLDVVSNVRNSLIKSDNNKEAMLQFNSITKPTHILPSILLRVLNDYKKINFTQESLQKFNVIDILMHLTKYLITNKTHYSVSYMKKLLNAKIKID
jgi:hypothetical protein